MMQHTWPSRLWYGAAFWTTRMFYTLGFSMRTEGWEHVPRSGPVLIVANHESFLDPVLVGLAVKRRIAYLARRTLFNNRFFGRLLGSYGVFPVDQEGIAKEGLRTVLTMLEQGDPVLIFPEGERTRTGELQPLRPGVTLILKRLHIPILPVGVAGTFEAFPRSARFPTFSPLFFPAGSRGTVAASVGAPFSSERYKDMPREEILQDLSAELGKVRDRAERLRLKPQ